MKTLLSLTILAILVCSFTSCNTISGAGRDVSGVGHDVSNGANAVKSSM